MAYDLHEEKSFGKDPKLVYEAALKAVAGLEGKVVKETPDDAKLEVVFNKTILGKVLGERTQMQIAVTPAAENGSLITVDAYPLDAVGRKLMFGARKGVTQTIISWFFAHLEHHLGKT